MSFFEDLKAKITTLSEDPRSRFDSICIEDTPLGSYESSHSHICDVDELLQVLIALEESLKLQTHYAKLLNMHDGGKRIGFETVDAWLERLEEVKKLAKEISDGE